MTVRNIHGTARQGSGWLDAWKSYNGYKETTTIPCGVYGCSEDATDGAHVIKDRTGRRQFIVPMCHEHNVTYGVDLQINDWATPMPVVQ